MHTDASTFLPAQPHPTAHLAGLMQGRQTLDALKVPEQKLLHSLGLCQLALLLVVPVLLRIAAALQCCDHIGQEQGTDKQGPCHCVHQTTEGEPCWGG